MLIRFGYAAISMMLYLFLSKSAGAAKKKTYLLIAAVSAAVVILSYALNRYYIRPAVVDYYNQLSSSSVSEEAVEDAAVDYLSLYS